MTSCVSVPRTGETATSTGCGSLARSATSAALSAATAAAVALPPGRFVEHRRKRPILITTDIVRAVSLGSIPLAAALGALTYPHLAAAGMVNAALALMFGSASQAHLKALVPHPALADADGRLESTLRLGSTAGPVLGGALAGFLGPARTLLADAVSFLAGAIAIQLSAHPLIRTGVDRKDL